MNHSHVACWKDSQDIGFDREEQQVSLIKVSLLTKDQEKWLAEHKLSVADLLNGRYLVTDEKEVCQKFYKPWNDVLEANGLRRSFHEDAIGEAMTKSIEKTLGMPFKFV